MAQHTERDIEPVASSQAVDYMEAYYKVILLFLFPLTMIYPSRSFGDFGSYLRLRPNREELSLIILGYLGCPEEHALCFRTASMI